MEVERSAGESRCPYPWCTTDHGRTQHPDDEDHRSAGLEVPLEVRSIGDPATAREVVVEVGLYHRIDDDRSWLSLDDGRDVRCDISVASVRVLLRSIENDPDLRGEVWAHA